MSTDDKVQIVIDANVLIKGIRLRDVLGCEDDQVFDSLYEVHTL